MRNLKQEAIRGAKWTTIASVFSILIGLVQWGIIGRYLGRDEIGEFALMSVFVGLGSIMSDAGISNGIIHFQNLTKRQLNTLYWFNVLVAICTYVLLYFITPWVVTFLFTDILNSDQVVTNIRIFALTIIILPFGQQFQYLLQKELLFDKLAMIDFLHKCGILFSLIYLLVISKLGILAVIYSFLFGAVINVICLFLFGSKRFYIPFPKHLDFKSIRSCLDFGKYQLGDHLTNYFSANLDKIFIGKMFGQEWLGIYELAYRLMIKPITLINPIFNKVSFPIFSKLQGDTTKLNNWYLRKIELIALLLFPMYFGMYTLSDQIVRLLYGVGWELTSETFQIIWILGMIMSIGNPLGSYLMALGKPEYGFMMNLYRVFLFSAVFYIGGTYMSFEQMILFFTICAIIFTWPLDYYIRHKLTQMKVSDHVSSFIKSMLISAVMCGIVMLFKQAITPHIGDRALVISCLCIIVGAASYIGLSFVFNRSSVSFVKSLIQI